MASLTSPLSVRFGPVPASAFPRRAPSRHSPTFDGYAIEEDMKHCCHDIEDQPIELVLSDENIAERKCFLEFDHEDEQRLKAMHQELEGSAMTSSSSCTTLSRHSSRPGDCSRVPIWNSCTRASPSISALHQIRWVTFTGRYPPGIDRVHQGGSRWHWQSAPCCGNHGSGL